MAVARLLIPLPVEESTVRFFIHNESLFVDCAAAVSAFPQEHTLRLLLSNTDTLRAKIIGEASSFLGENDTY